MSGNSGLPPLVKRRNTKTPDILNLPDQVTACTEENLEFREGLDKLLRDSQFELDFLFKNKSFETSQKTLIDYKKEIQKKKKLLSFYEHLINQKIQVPAEKPKLTRLQLEEQNKKLIQEKQKLQAELNTYKQKPKPKSKTFKAYKQILLEEEHSFDSQKYQGKLKTHFSYTKKQASTLKESLKTTLDAQFSELTLKYGERVIDHIQKNRLKWDPLYKTSLNSVKKLTKEMFAREILKPEELFLDISHEGPPEKPSRLLTRRNSLRLINDSFTETQSSSTRTLVKPKSFEEEATPMFGKHKSFKAFGTKLQGSPSFLREAPTTSRTSNRLRLGLF